MKAVIGVCVASHPLFAAGNTWAFLQWVLGFRELGWEVWMIEALTSDRCIDAAWHPCPFAESANSRHWRQVVDRFGLADAATLLVDGDAPNVQEAKRFAADADLVLNVSGRLRIPEFRTPRARRVYLDLDPAFTQIWADVYGVDMNFTGHDAFFSVGTRLGREGCLAPTCGIDWMPTLPPVVLRYWPLQPQSGFVSFSTVAHWRGYGWCEWNGRWYKDKAEEFTKLVSLPRRVGARMEIATEVRALQDELGAFSEAGWTLEDGYAVSRSLECYETYIRDSSAEFSAVKGGYVLSQSGWFSDRSVCYLASGRPVVLQDTGIGRAVPATKGLHLFSDLEGAVTACRTVVEHFSEEQHAARTLAETYFASHLVIERMLERLSI
jgi:hypothetical protein